MSEATDQITVTQDALEASWRARVTGAPECTDRGYGRYPFDPLWIVWTHSIYRGVDYGVRIACYSESFRLSDDWTLGTVPDWVPRPPDGWDTNVSRIGGVQ